MFEEDGRIGDSLQPPNFYGNGCFIGQDGHDFSAHSMRAPWPHSPMAPWPHGPKGLRLGNIYTHLSAVKKLLDKDNYFSLKRDHRGTVQRATGGTMFTPFLAHH